VPGAGCSRGPLVTWLTLASAPGGDAKLSGVQLRRVGQSGLKVSELGLGTLTWGRETNSDEAAAQLIAFHEAGGTLIDTAVSYSGGGAEEILGQLLADVVPRDELVIATKAGLSRAGDEPVVDASRRGLLTHLDGSLRRLGVGHVDLWQLHVPDDTVAIEETLGALEHAVSTGKARYVGVSNFSGWRLGQAAATQLLRAAQAPIVSNQVQYSLLERGIEREVVAASAALGVGLLAHSPLGGGVLTGKYRGGVPTDSRAAAGYRNLADFRRAEEAGIVEAVATAAEGLATAPIAVALSWVRDQPGVSSVVLGARTLGQLTAALTSESLVLPVEIRSALDDVSAPLLGYPEQVF
jgi:aryl-alcohol dehydrogenase-like predicted oxidoreductase